MKPRDQIHKNTGPLGFLVLMAITACFALRSWRAWGDPVIDFPQQLYLAWRISAGDILFRDIQYFYGPLSQWLNGLLFYIAGPSYLTLTLANLGIAFLLSVLIYASLRRAFDWITGLAAAAAFLLIHAFQQLEPFSCFNFIAPYSHEATHGTVLLFVLVFFCAAGRPWMARGFLYGLLVLLKPEFILAGGAVLATSFLIARPSRKEVAKFLIGIAIPLSLTFFYLTASSKLVAGEALRATFGSVVPLFTTKLANTPLYASSLGIDDLGRHLREILAAVGALALVLGIAAGLDRRLEGSLRLYAGASFLCLLAAALYFLPALELSRAWAVLSVAGFAFVVVAYLRGTIRGEEARLSLLLGVSAVALSTKIFFNPVFTMFGFYLLAPGTVFLSSLGLYVLPKLAGRPGSFVLRGSALVLLSAVALQAAALSARFYDAKTLPLGTGSDFFFAFDELMVPGPASARLVKEAASRVARLTPPGSTLLAIPEGLLVNYLERRRNPTPFLQSFILSPLFDASGGAAGIINGLKKNPPDYVLYLHRAAEFPGPIFKIRGEGGFANEALR
ncbi:MAG: hypothetical protein ACXVCG_03760, partial [Bdellovibrionota bacterium]